MMSKHVEGEAEWIARLVREACVRAAEDGYEDAAMDGLCHEGAWEAAVSAIKRLDLDAILAEIKKR